MRDSIWFNAIPWFMIPMIPVVWLQPIICLYWEWLVEGGSLPMELPGESDCWEQCTELPQGKFNISGGSWEALADMVMLIMGILIHEHWSGYAYPNIMVICLSWWKSPIYPQKSSLIQCWVIMGMARQTIRIRQCFFHRRSYWDRTTVKYNGWTGKEAMRLCR